MGRVVLVGTVHGGESSRDLVRRALEDVRPDCVLVEASPRTVRNFDLLLRNGSGPGHADVQKTRELAMGFETTEAIRYAREQGIPYHYADKHSRFVEGFIRAGSQGMMEHNRKPHFMPQRLERLQRTYEKGLEVAPQLLTLERHPGLPVLLLAFGPHVGLGLRDKHMAQRVRRYAAQHDTVAMTVGYSHALRLRWVPTLYNRILDLNPERVFIHDYLRPE